MRWPWILLTAATALCGCQRQTQETAIQETAIAEVGGEKVTAEELAYEMKLQARGDRQETLDALLERKRLVAAARAAGIDQDPAARRAMDGILMTRLLERDLQPKLDAVQVGDVEVREYYDSHQKEFTQPAHLSLAMLFRASREEDTARRDAHRTALEAARNEAASLPAAEGFGALAISNSEDQSSRYRGGNIGSFTAQDDYAEPFPALRDAAADLAPGDLTSVLAFPEGLYVVRVVRREVAQVRPFESVRDAIHRRLLGEYEQALRKDFQEKLRQKYPAHLH